MAENTLVSEFKAWGRALLVELHQNSFEVSKAIWMYSDETDEWLLFLATPLCERENLTELYGRVRKALEALQSPIDRHQVRLLSAKREPAISIPAGSPDPISRPNGALDGCYTIEA